MKKLKKILLIILLLVPLVGCQNQKNEWKETYQLTYFYLKDCSNEDDYGYGPMVFLEGYMAILGAGNEDDYVEHLVRAIQGKELNEASEIETYYYLKDGKVQNS